MYWKNLLRRKVRTLLTVLGIAVGIAAIVALRSMASGYAAGMNSAVSAAGALAGPPRRPSTAVRDRSIQPRAPLPDQPCTTADARS